MSIIIIYCIRAKLCLTLKAIDSTEASKSSSTEMVCKSTIPVSMSVSMK